jgi:hypothetical protein
MREAFDGSLPALRRGMPPLCGTMPGDDETGLNVAHGQDLFDYLITRS